MSANFDAVFVESEQFDTDYSSPEMTADFAHMTDTAATTAKAEDVRSGRIFFDHLGRKTTGTFIWNFKGWHPYLMNKNLYTGTFKLSQTTFPDWTPSTTASVILATTNVGTFTANMEAYDYLIHWRATCDAVFPSGTTMKAAPFREIADIWQCIIKRPNSLKNIEATNFNGNACLTLSTTPLNVYYNSDGTKTYTYSISYGIYPAAVAATFSNSTSNTPTVTIKRPTFSARCSSSYFSTARAGQIDQDKTTLKIHGELWRVDKGAVERSLYDSLIDLYNNGI